jgi:hypothetical protein
MDFSVSGKLQVSLPLFVQVPRREKALVLAAVFFQALAEPHVRSYPF